METKVYQWNPTGENGEAVAGAAAVLRSGGLVAIPTETVYGLGADGLNGAAVRRCRLWHAAWRRRSGRGR